MNGSSSEHICKRKIKKFLVKEKQSEDVDALYEIESPRGLAYVFMTSRAIRISL